jgi:Tfp pilus assembly protein PilV
MKKFQKGQTLIEVAITLGVGSIVIIALVVLAATSLRNAQDSIRRSESAKIANAGIEAIVYYKNVLSLDDELFPTDGNYKCYQISSSGQSIEESEDFCTGVTVVSPGTNLDYVRTIKITNSNGEYLVQSKVDWQTANGKINTVTIPRILTNWK